MIRRGQSFAIVVLSVAAALAVGLVIAPRANGSGSGAGRSPTTAHRSTESSLAPTTTLPSTTTSPPTTTTTVAPAGPPYQVQDETIVLTDPTRPTVARGSVPATSSRVLATVIRKPIGAQGPLPLVVFAHGWDSDPGKYEVLLDTWAAAGYLVAAPTFPDSADTYPGTPVTDFANQARDLSFVITSLLGGRVGAIDPNRIAVAGHSDGGSDVCVLAMNPAYADHRIRAYLAMSGDIQVPLPGPWGASTPGDFEATVGTNDQYDEQPKTTQAFDTANMDKVMLTVSGGDHLGMYIGSSGLSLALRQETLRFLAAALGGTVASSAQLAADSEPTGDSAITVTAGP